MIMTPLMKAVVLLAAVTALFSATAAANQSPSFACSGANYSSSSSYQQALELLSSTLPQRVSKAARMFATNSVVTDEVTYALAYCRGDADTVGCSRCIYQGLQDAEVACKLSKEVLIGSDLCTLQLSGTAMNWSSQVNTAVAHADTLTVQGRTFEMAVDLLVTTVSSLAANSSRRFATAVEQIDTDNSHYRAYGLAQCVADLTPADCASCLEDLRSINIITGWSGGWSSTMSCTFQFHLHKFFASEPMQQIPVVTLNTPRGHRKKRRINMGVVVGVSVAVVVIILSLLALVIFRRKRRSSQKTPKTSSEELRRISDEEEGLGAPTADQTACEACPSALGFFDEITARAYGKMILLFLDYDGTLTPIIKIPLNAVMSNEMRQTVDAAARWFPTSIVTGRMVSKAEEFVKLANLNYAGSHGMGIKICGQEDHFQPIPGLEPIVTEATERLEQAVQGINGAFVENNKFCVSVHFRNVDEKDWKLVEDTVNTVLSGFPASRLASGKMVWELRSKEPFTKGDAVNHLLDYLLENLGMDSSRVLAIHIGDDVTDEDAFQMLRENGYGFGILVSTEPKPTQAFYSLKCPAEVMNFLDQLVAWKESEDGIVELP